MRYAVIVEEGESGFGVHAGFARLRCSSGDKAGSVEVDPGGDRISFGRIARVWPSDSSSIFKC
jgi:hypothetical protein